MLNEPMDYNYVYTEELINGKREFVKTDIKVEDIDPNDILQTKEELDAIGDFYEEELLQYASEQFPTAEEYHYNKEDNTLLVTSEKGKDLCEVYYNIENVICSRCMNESIN